MFAKCSLSTNEETSTLCRNANAFGRNPAPKLDYYSSAIHAFHTALGYDKLGIVDHLATRKT